MDGYGDNGSLGRGLCLAVLGNTESSATNLCFKTDKLQLWIRNK